MRSIVLSVFLCLIAASTVMAQSTRYSSWSNPNSPTATAGQDMETFLEQLNKLIDEAEKANAADPVFLRDLRDLARGATRPWKTPVLSETFNDGDFTANPTWRVMSGEYFIETGWGLRNRLAQAAQATQSGSQQEVRGEDLAKALLGQVLNQALGGGQQNQGTATAAAPVRNVIVTDVGISNAFAISTEISSWVADGHWEVGVFQGAAAEVGYRVVYRTGQPLQLIRIGSRGTSVVDASASPLAIEDKAFHKLEWTRGLDGAMRVTVDGEVVIQTSDRGFSDPFDGVRIGVLAGDFIVREITASGL